MSEINELGKTETSNYENNKTGTDIRQPLSWHWEMPTCLMMSPGFSLLYIYLSFFMAERFIAAAVVFHVICIKEWGSILSNHWKLWHQCDL